MSDPEPTEEQHVQISINNETVDFTLEEEKTLGEVYDGINSWLEKSGFIVLGCEVNGTPVPDVQEPSWRAREIGTVDNLDLSAALPVEIRLRHYSVLEQYFGLLSAAIERNDVQALSELSPELGYALDTMEVLLRDSSGDTRYKALVSRIAESGLLETGAVHPGQLVQLAGTIESVRSLFLSRIEEITDPAGQIRKTLAFLSALIPDINNVSVLLQTGRDREAMTTVIRFIEGSQKLLRLFSCLRTSGTLDPERITVDGMSLSNYYEEFNTILNELLEAFEARDSVLIGDLLEYEITPRLEKMSTSMESPKRE